MLSNPVQYILYSNEAVFMETECICVVLQEYLMNPSHELV